jgi:hypothetical protein
MSARRIQDENDAKDCIERTRASGFTLSAWARAEGVDGRSHRAWNVNLARGGAGVRRKKASPAKPGRQMRLVELVSMTAPSLSGRYLVRLAQLELEVDAQFDETTLRRLIGVLRSC